VTIRNNHKSNQKDGFQAKQEPGGVQRGWINVFRQYGWLFCKRSEQPIVRQIDMPCKISINGNLDNLIVEVYLQVGNLTAILFSGLHRMPACHRFRGFRFSGATIVSLGRMYRRDRQIRQIKLFRHFANTFLATFGATVVNVVYPAAHQKNHEGERDNGKISENLFHLVQRYIPTRTICQKRAVFLGFLERRVSQNKKVPKPGLLIL
jgi:hypothetical protein